jgi:hypothetical protein
LIGAELKGFVETDTEMGAVKVGDITLTGAEVELKSSDGVPLIIRNFIGNGEVTFVNIKAYPAEAGARNIYTEQLKRLGQYMVDIEKEKGWMKCSVEVGFTVYDNALNGIRTIYFINMNWWAKGYITSKASLLWGDKIAELSVNRDVMNIINLSDNWAIQTSDNETDVIEINE